MVERGKIAHRNRAAQIRDFSGLRWGNITPTDIDLIVDFQDKLWVIGELKHTDAPLPYGQQLALERLARDLHTVGKPVLCVVAEHSTEIGNDVIAADSIVRTYYWKKGKVWSWATPRKPIVLKSAIDMFLEWHRQNGG